MPLVSSWASRMLSWSVSTSTPPETAQNGLMRPDGVSIPARGRQRLISSQNASARQQSRTSLDTVSEPICQTVIWTGRKASIS